jgi:hypothetical protein
MAEDLPDCALIRIFKKLPLADRVKMKLVCRNWERVAETASLWPQHVKLSREAKAEAEEILRASGKRLKSLVLKDRRDSDALLKVGDRERGSYMQPNIRSWTTYTQR